MGVVGKGCVCDNAAKWESGKKRECEEDVSYNFGLIGQCWGGQVAKECCEA